MRKINQKNKEIVEVGQNDIKLAQQKNKNFQGVKKSMGNQNPIPEKQEVAGFLGQMALSWAFDELGILHTEEFYSSNHKQGVDMYYVFNNQLRNVEVKTITHHKDYFYEDISKGVPSEYISRYEKEHLPFEAFNKESLIFYVDLDTKDIFNVDTCSIFLRNPIDTKELINQGIVELNYDKKKVFLKKPLEFELLTNQDIWKWYDEVKMPVF